MESTKSLLERLRSKYSTPDARCSDYRLAKILGLSKTAMNRYMTHNGGMGNAVGLRVAAELNLQPEYVLACLAWEREQDAEVRPYWERLATGMVSGKTARVAARARRASKVAAVLLSTGIAALSLTTPPQAHAGERATSVYSVKSRIHWRNRRFAHILPRRRRRPRRRDFGSPAALPIVAT